MSDNGWKRHDGCAAISHHSGWVAFRNDLTLEEREMLLDLAEMLLRGVNDGRLEIAVDELHDYIMSGQESLRESRLCAMSMCLEGIAMSLARMEEQA